MLRNETQFMLRVKSAIKKQVMRIQGAEPACVYAYDFEKQRVDVQFKNYPERPPLMAVPIMGAGGGYSVVKPLAKGDVGLLVPMASDSRHSFLSKRCIRPYSKMRHEGITWAFFPDPPMLTDEAPPAVLDKNATPSNLDKAGPGDMVFTFGSSHIIFKSGGEIVIQGKEVYILGDSQTTSGAKAAIREGDTGDGGPGAGALPAPSGRKVYLG